MCALDVGTQNKDRLIYTDEAILIGGIVTYQNIWKYEGYGSPNLANWKKTGDMGLLDNGITISYHHCKSIRELLMYHPCKLLYGLLVLNKNILYHKIV